MSVQRSVSHFSFVTEVDKSLDSEKKWGGSACASKGTRKQFVPQMCLQQTPLHLKKQRSPELNVKSGQHKGSAHTSAFGWVPSRYTTLTFV